MEVFTNKLNKYLIQIIKDYAIIDHNKLIKENIKDHQQFTIYINQDLTIEDIIVKCFHLGYKGFILSGFYERNFTKYIDSILNNLIYKGRDMNKNVLYRFVNDDRDLFFISIDMLDNVILRSIEIVKNVKLNH